MGLFSSLFSQSIAKESYTFFDTETTGLSPLFGDRMIEIALIKTQNGEPVDDGLNLLINPGMHIPDEASSVNNITDEMVAHYPVFNREIAESILDYIKDSTLVAHNAAFDVGFLSSEFARIGLSWTNWSYIDSLRIAQKVLPNLSKKNLGSLFKYYNLEKEMHGDFHRALYDTEALMHVFFKMLDEEGVSGKDLEGLIMSFGGDGKNVAHDITGQFREAFVDHNVLKCKYKRRDDKIVDLQIRPLAPVWAMDPHKRNPHWYIMAENVQSGSVITLICQNVLEIY